MLKSEGHEIIESKLMNYANRLLDDKVGRSSLTHFIYFYTLEKNLYAVHINVYH